MRRVRLGVLGVGSWTAVNHLPTIEHRQDVELVAAVDTNAERRDNVRARFPFQLVTDDVGAALAMDLDAVIVGATPDAHFDLCLAALDAGAHVLCEKPFTTRGSDARKIVEAAQQRDRHLLTSYGWNYMAIVRDAKTLLDREGIGTVEHVQIHMATALREMYQKTMSVWGRPDEFRPIPSSYTSLDKGAGYAQAQLSHALGIGLWLTGLRGEAVFGFMSSPGAEVDLHDALSVRFEGGALGSISGSVCPLGANDNRHQMEVRLFGSEGQLLVDLDRALVWLYRDAQTDIRLPLAEDAGAYECTGPSNTLIDLALGREVENCSPGELAARATEITEAAYNSWRSGAVEAIR